MGGPPGASSLARSRTLGGVPEREEGGPQHECRPGDESEQLGTVLDEHGRLRGRHDDVDDHRDPERTRREQQQSDLEVAEDHVSEPRDEPEEGEPVGGGDQRTGPWRERRGFVQQQEIVEHDHEAQRGGPSEQLGDGFCNAASGDPPDHRGAARERQHDDADVRQQPVRRAVIGVGSGDDLAVAQQVARRQPRLQRRRRDRDHDREGDADVDRGRRAREGAQQPRGRGRTTAGSTHGHLHPTHATLRSGIGYGKVGAGRRHR